MNNDQVVELLQEISDKLSDISMSLDDIKKIVMRQTKTLLV